MSLSSVEKLVDKYGRYATIIFYRGLRQDFGLNGAYKLVDGKPVIFIEADQSENEKRVILTEEFMHMLYSVGDILDDEDIQDVKQEQHARRMAYKYVITTDDLIRCYEMGLQTVYEVSSELDLPASFVNNAVEYFKTKIGEHGKYKNYDIVIGKTINFYKQ